MPRIKPKSRLQQKDTCPLQDKNKNEQNPAGYFVNKIQTFGGKRKHPWILAKTCDDYWKY